MKIKRILALIICLTFLCCACGAEPKSAGEDMNPLKRGDKDYGEIHFPPYDSAALYRLLEEMSNLCDKNGDLRQIIGLYERVLAEYDLLSDCCLYSYIAYCDKPEDKQLSNMHRSYFDVVRDVNEAICLGIKEVLNSPHSQGFSEHLGNEKLLRLAEYEADDETVKGLWEVENALRSEYDDYYSGTVPILVEAYGESWDLQKLAERQEHLSEAQFHRIYDALTRKNNQILGEIIIRLAGVRNEIARYWGYDNYFDAVWSQSYLRGYSFSDYSKISRLSREYLSTPTKELYNYSKDFCMEDFEAYSFLSSLCESELVTSRVKEALNYIIDHRLIHIAPAGAYDMAFADKYHTLGEPIIYTSFGNSNTLLTTLAHECGHAVNFYLDDSPTFWNIYPVVDVNEIQSNGFMALYAEAIASLYPEYRLQIKGAFLSYLLDSLLGAGAQTDFERELYTMEQPELDKLNDKAKNIFSSYGYSAEYDWCFIHHYVNSPGYVVSYVMSSVAALALWVEYEEEPPRALADFDELLIEGAASDYCDVIEKYALKDIYSPAFYRSFCDLIEKSFP